ncbi:MAG TPA: hypothetical protein VIN34_09360 [Candidatus Limnocylindria bacterium]|jgi:hypothetical protein
MDDHAQTEWQWFGGVVRDSLLRPRRFAAAQSHEHYGLAGILVAFIAGMLLSLSIDALIIAAKGLSPFDFVGRGIADAALVGIRLTVLTALAALAVQLASRLDRRIRDTGDFSIDRAFTAIAFGLSPLVLTPALAVILGILPEALPVAAVLAGALAIRLVLGLFWNLRRLLPLGFAAAGLLILAVAVAFTFADQVSRVRFLALGYAPRLAPELPGTPARGTTFEGDGFSLVVPEGWRNGQRGIAGEAGRFETDTASLIVLRVRGSAFVTPDVYAETAGTPWLRGTDIARSERIVDRTRDLVLVDDTIHGKVDGRPVVLRQFTAVVGQTGMALLFRYIDPPDEGAALAEATSIALSWHVAGR